MPAPDVLAPPRIGGAARPEGRQYDPRLGLNDTSGARDEAFSLGAAAAEPGG